MSCAAALALEALHKQVLPFLLRRLKEDVLHDLPPKIIQDYYCDLSDLQKQMYDDFSHSQAAHAAEAEVASNKPEAAKGQQHVFQSLQYLRKLVNHPALILKDDKEATKTAFSKANLSGPPDISDIQHAPKLLALKCVSLGSDDWLCMTLT
jgi:TATA-binding protein-associated factor